MNTFFSLLTIRWDEGKGKISEAHDDDSLSLYLSCSVSFPCELATNPRMERNDEIFLKIHGSDFMNIHYLIRHMCKVLTRYS